MDRMAIFDFIRRQRYGVISSIAGNGTPQSALVGIASSSRLEIIFDTVKTSRKYPNLIQRPVCSLVIGWSGEQTLQLEGVAEEVREADLRRLQDIYFAQWPECREHTNWPGIAYFVVHPHWIRYSDYDRSPPLIEEFEKEALSSDF